MEINYRTLGVHFESHGLADLTLWAPIVKNATVFLPKSDTRIPLTAEANGYWHVTTGLIKPGDCYQYLLDGREPLPDPASVSQPDGVHGPSEALDLLSFQWTDQSWQNTALCDYIIYEIHPGTFTAEGTFLAMEAKLDHLLELGITAVEIMPVSQFPGSRNWGYDGVFPFCVQNTYGGAHGLQHFVNTCHQKGLAVILDVVYNHMGPEGNNLEAFGQYFTNKYHTPWGDAINFDDAWCDGVRRYFIENALMWFRDFHVDALRLDAVHAIKDFSPVHILQEIRNHVDSLSEMTGKQFYLIVESDLNDTKLINPLEKAGFGMDAQWLDEFHHALRVCSGQEKTGYYQDFDGIGSLAKSFSDAYVYDGTYSEHRKKKFGVKATDNPGEQFVVFSQNHDHVGNRMLGERTSQLVSFEMQKLLAGTVLISPYLPLLFMGEEYGETNPFLYFVSHTDPELAEAVRKGRKKEFQAFHLEGEAPDPMAAATFENSKLQWDLPTREPHQTLFKYYQKLIALRKQIPALHAPDRHKVTVVSDPQQQVIILQRRHASGDVACILNFSQHIQKVTTPTDSRSWKKRLASSDQLWNGPQDAAELISSECIVQPESIIIYSA